MAKETVSRAITNWDTTNPIQASVVAYASDPTIKGLVLLNPDGSKITGGGVWSGTVTSVSVVSANGLAGTVATATTTPAITLSTTVTWVLKGNWTAISAAAAGTDYVAPNGAITWATKTKITYDAKGLVTAGADATTADIADSTDRRYVTDAQLVVIGNTSWTNTGDQDLSPYETIANAAATYIPLTQKAANNGVATLDAGGKIPAAQLPSSVMDFKGTWNANTNTPTLANGTGSAWDVYLTSTAGTTDFWAWGITFAVGDWAVYNGTIWEKSINSNAVVSVNSQTGVVVLDADDIDDTATTNKFVTAGDLTNLGNLSGVNTGDQTTISGNAWTATALQTARNIYGNSFDGTADLTQVIASTYGGTGNGFTKFSWPTTSEKTFTLPNATATILTDNATVTVAQGGTGITSFGSGVATWLWTPSSANLAAAVTDETGTGALVFATNPVIAKPQTDAFFGAIATYTPSAAATATLDCSLNNKHFITMPAGNITIALSNITAGQCITVSTTQDGTGSRTVTWFSTIRRAGWTTPTLTTTANKRDTFGFMCTGSGTYDGFIIWQNI